MQIKTRLRFERSTAGTHFFVEVDEEGRDVPKYGEGGTIKSMYVRKASMAKAPRFVDVTIETVD